MRLDHFLHYNEIRTRNRLENDIGLPLIRALWVRREPKIQCVPGREREISIPGRRRGFYEDLPSEKMGALVLGWQHWGERDSRDDRLFVHEGALQSHA